MVPKVLEPLKFYCIIVTYIYIHNTRGIAMGQKRVKTEESSSENSPSASSSAVNEDTENRQLSGISVKVLIIIICKMTNS